MNQKKHTVRTIQQMRDNGETITRATRAGVSAYVVDGISQKRVRPILDAAIELLRNPFLMPCTDNCQNVPITVLLSLLQNTRRHVTVTLGNQRIEKILALGGELGKGCLEHVPFLEFLDLLFTDLVTGEYRPEQAANQARLKLSYA